jgi:hypothetical protein
MRKHVQKHSPDEVVEVPDAEDMDDETFIKHIEHRHAEECKVEGFIARHAIDAWIGPYRAFHDRLHSIAVPGQHDHEHELEEPE